MDIVNSRFSNITAKTQGEAQRNIFFSVLEGLISRAEIEKGLFNNSAEVPQC